MIMCKKYLAILYGAFLTRSKIRIAFIEAWLGGFEVQPGMTADEQRNEPTLFGALFSDECRHELESLYRAAIESIRGKTFDKCNDGIDALVFLQEIVATAMWKHRCKVGETLEEFARKNDRLDILQERRRLHLEAQQ